MNIFLSQDNIVNSIKDLDDLRLQKQLVEVYQLLTLAIREKEEGHEIKAGHYHHPVYLFYKDNIDFLAYYGYICCCEYLNRFDKQHTLLEYFRNKCTEMLDISVYGNSIEDIFIAPKYIPYYMEGSKGQPNYIRTCDNVSALFQTKLCKKWEQDKAKGRQTRWTNRDVPQFYQDFMKGE